MKHLVAIGIPTFLALVSGTQAENLGFSIVLAFIVAISCCITLIINNTWPKNST